MAHGGIPASGVLYGGVDGPLFHGGSLMPSFFAPSSSADNAGGPSMPGGATLPAVHEPPPPKFSKLEFPTYDGSVDPLNLLNQCDQFFRGQRTIASEWTWLASYHVRGAAQMWYYALEQDEGGMPPCDRFWELSSPVWPSDPRESPRRARSTALHLHSVGLRRPLPGAGMPRPRCLLSPAG